MSSDCVNEDQEQQSKSENGYILVLQYMMLVNQKQDKLYKKSIFHFVNIMPGCIKAQKILGLSHEGML